MPANEKEIRKIYNKKTNMMFVIKDLMNPGTEDKNKILFTIVRCNEDEVALDNVDYFMDIADIRTLYNLVLHNLLVSEWKIPKGSKGEARIITFKQNIYGKSNSIGYTIKIDIGQGKEIKNNTWVMIKQTSSLIYNIGLIDLVSALTKTISVIDNNEQIYRISAAIKNALSLIEKFTLTEGTDH